MRSPTRAAGPPALLVASLAWAALALTAPRARAEVPTPSVAASATVAPVLEVASARAEVPTATVAEAPVLEVVVRAVRPRHHPDPSAVVSRVSEARLERARARGEDLGGVLDAVPGARVLDQGGPVSTRRLTVRGGTPAQALLVVDGVALRAPFAGGFDLGLVHPESVARLELLRGGQGATFGEGALTGVLWVDTRRPSDAAAGALTLGYGSFNTARASGTVWAGPVTVSGALERTDGDFGYVSSLFALPDQARIRTNNDAARGSLAVSAEHEFADQTRFTLRAGGSLREGGVPGLAASPGESLDARERRATAQTRLGLETRTREGGRGELGLQVALLDLDYAEPSSGRASQTRFWVVGGEGALSLALGGGHVARGALGASVELSESSEHGAPRRPRAHLAASDEVHLGGLTLFGALRLEVIGALEPVVLPRIGARQRLGGGFFVSGGAGRSLRAPSIDELYHPRVVGFSGNPELLPESSWEVDGAFGWSGGGAEARVALFAREIADAILYLNQNAFEVRPENVGEATAAGAELEVSWGGRALGFELAACGSLSFLEARLGATGGPLPTQPRWSAAGELSIRRGVVEVDSAVRAFGPTTSNLWATPESEVPAYLRWDLGLAVRAAEWLTMSLEAQNLLDERRLQTVSRFPLPGRTFFAALRVTTGEGT